MVGGCGGTSPLAPTTPAGNVVEPLAARPDLSLVYRAQGGLTPIVDKIGVGAMKVGDSEVAGSMPSWQLGAGGLTLGITQPAGPPITVVSGAFATPVAFAAGSVFGMRAVFAELSGPHRTDDTWAVTVAARTGNERHLATETLAAATLQVRADGARLNTPGASVPSNLSNVPQDVYDVLFRGSKFTLELLVDRVTGTGNAVLRVDQFEVSRAFTYSAFTSTGGPAITAVGPTVAVANGPGQSTSVKVLDFQVFK
jgi:hypothetical protein